MVREYLKHDRNRANFGLLVLAACGGGSEGGDRAAAPDGDAPPSCGADSGATSEKGGNFTADPVQLTLDPAPSSPRRRRNG